MHFDGTVTTMTLERRLPLGEFSSSKVNKLGRFTQSQPLKRTRLPSIKTLINCTPELPAITVAKPQSDCRVAKKEKPRRDLSSVSERLRVRLQLAYFKLKTNQTSIKFKELKRQFELNSEPPSRKKRRKLVVSQGNYKTPLKSNTVHDIAKPTTAKPDNFLQFHDRSNSPATAHTTPVNDSNAIAPLPEKQNTPMSVKAAKSLLHLFTSSQH
ncbi:hypothetical protein HG536_0A08700 [Torulaspora globosa]|uniref:Transcription factor NRM1 n=1 Tax=Torulaspora globosa TaxID=48254 RepID=A0A7G3ZC17_9SACH|nr:uncharacterized protein HG536_0A08700 [Torulaspora globosa]QLL31053.1 hypothetical protein HG536_0A08700 [Torulaspora globosa]